MIAELSRGMTTSGLDAPIHWRAMAIQDLSDRLSIDPTPYFHGAREFQSGTDDVGFTAGDLIRRQDAIYSSP
jgi:hypothetical protein